MSYVCQVGIKIAAHVSETQTLHVRVHGTLGGHFRSGEHSKFESPTFKLNNRQMFHGPDYLKTELSAPCGHLDTCLHMAHTGQ